MIRKAAGVVIIKDFSILLLHRIDKDWWEVPGGKSEEGESLSETAIREAKEEIGCDVEIVRALGNTFFKAVGYDLDYAWFLAKIMKKQTPKIAIKKEYDDLKFIPIEKLHDYHLSSSAKNLLTEIDNGRIAFLTEKDILDLIKKDKWMMEVLRAAESLHLPDWWIGAGFVRSKVWDYLHGYEIRTPLPDVDLIYFDPSDFTKAEAGEYSTKAEDKYQEILNKHKELCVKWSVTNQARMHIYHHRKPYINSEEALSEWAETATCIGVCLKKGELRMIALHGMNDLANLILRPIPGYKSKYKFEPNMFNKRISEKNWFSRWPKLRTI